MSEWAPETPHLAGRAPVLVYLDTLPLEHRRWVLQLQEDIPELRKKITDARRSAARSKRGSDVRRQYVLEFHKARRQLHDTGERLRAMSHGYRTPDLPVNCCIVWLEQSDGYTIRIGGVTP